MRYLAIDYGEKNIGLAYCDKLEIATRPLPPINNKDLTFAINELARTIDQHNIESIIVGIPLGKDNEETQISIKARFFANRIKDFSDIPIEFWNESFSSQQAVQNMIAGGTTKKTRSRMIDSYAAMVILKDFLENKEIER